eukprot:5888380-Pyramimonas_sp.AAC.1
MPSTASNSSCFASGVEEAAVSSPAAPSATPARSGGARDWSPLAACWSCCTCFRRAANSLSFAPEASAGGGFFWFRLGLSGVTSRK